MFAGCGFSFGLCLGGVMKHISHAVSHLTDLQAIPDPDDLRTGVAQVQPVLDQVYSARHDPARIWKSSAGIISNLPNAVLPGAMTAAEVTRGRTLTGQTVIVFAFFISMKATSISLACPAGEEPQIGNALRKQ